MPNPGTGNPAKNSTAGHNLLPEQLEKLDYLIRQQPITGLTDKTIASLVPCARATVSRRRVALAGAGEHTEAPTAKQAIAQEVELAERKAARWDPEGEARDLLALFPDQAALTPDETMRLLSILATTSVNPNAQVAALRELEAARLRHAPPAELGPPDPLTDDERVLRLSACMDACGLSITRRALEKVWPEVAVPASPHHA